MRLKLLAVAILAAGPSLAQDAAQDPCALALYHYDRASEMNDEAGRAYRRNVTSMIGVASTSMGFDWADGLDIVRANCAYNPTTPFVETVAGVIDAAHKAETNELQASIEQLEGELENSSHEQVQEAIKRSREIYDDLLEEREKVATLRARISKLVASQ